MKEGWEIKTLGDVCDVLNGLWIGKKEPFVNICVIRNTNFTKDCKLNLDNVSYIDAEVKQFTTRKLKVGDIIVEKSGGSEKQPVGRVVLFDIESGDYSFSNFTSALRVKSGIDLNPNYLHKCLYAHYLRGETFKLQSKTTGLHNLDMKGYLKLPIPVPSIAEQEKIVAELDCLSGIIEKKKQQLKEYDALAQSIFYEMFGDPVENEKGWEMKNLGEIASEIFAGGDKPKDISSIKTDEYAYPVYANGDGDRGLLGFSKNYRVGSKAVTIGARGASVGNCRICNEKFTPVVRLITIVPSVNIDIMFLYHYVLHIEWDANGAGQAQLTTPNVVNKKVFLPPLSLQQEFASKIAAIEKQKELIKKSIEEVETLFNSRMEYYFN